MVAKWYPGINVTQIFWHLSYSWGKTPGQTSTRKLARPGIEPGPAAWEVTALPLDHSGGPNTLTIPRFTFRCHKFFFSRWEVSSETNPKLEDHPLSAARNCLFNIFTAIPHMGAKVDWDFRISDLINPCGEFRWSPEGPVSQIQSPNLLVGAHGIFSDLLRFVQMLKRELVAESNGKLPHLFIPSKTAT